MTTRIGKILEINESLSEVNESDSSLTINGKNYAVSFIKGGDRYEGVNYSLVLKSKEDILVYPRIFTYSGGQSQGSSRSESENFLEVLGYGDTGNGSGVKGTPKPYLSRYIVDFLESVISGKSYNKEAVAKYERIKHTFSPKAKASEIKSAISY